MTTYKSYQEAKILNQGFDIYLNQDGMFEVEPNSNNSKCKPLSHCLSVREFFCKGFRFVEGDYLLNGHGSVRYVGVNAPDGYSYLSVGAANQRSEADSDWYVLKSEQLDNKGELKSKPKTRTEYEKVDLNDAVKIIDDEMSNESNLYFRCSEGDIVPISQISGCDLIMNRHKLVRKVEKEITWQDELKDFLSGTKYLSEDCPIVLDCDDGYRRKEWDSEFISMCHHIASITDKPE